MEPNEIWLIEWSESYKQFHIQTLEETIVKNRRAFYNRNGLDWQPIGIVFDLEEAQPLIDHLEHERREHLPDVIRERLHKIVNRPR